MHVKNLSISQTKIIFIGLALAMVFIIFFFFVFLPGLNAVNKVKSEFITTEEQINTIESVIKEAETPNQGISSLKKKFEELNNRLPPSEGDSFRAFADLAKNSNIKITLFNPDEKKLFLDDNGNKVLLEGKALEVIFLTMEMKSSFSDLVKFLEGLRKTFPTLEITKKIRITKEGNGSNLLNVRIELNLYLLIQEK